MSFNGLHAMQHGFSPRYQEKSGLILVFPIWGIVDQEKGWIKNEICIYLVFLVFGENMILSI